MSKEDGMNEEVLIVVASKYGGQEDCLLFLTFRHFFFFEIKFFHNRPKLATIPTTVTHAHY